MKSKAVVIISIISTIGALVLILVIPSALAYDNYISDKTLSPIAEVNTRTFFYGPCAVNFTLLNLAQNVLQKLQFMFMDLREMSLEANEEFNRLQISLLHNNYRIPLVGFGWDSKIRLA